METAYLALLTLSYCQLFAMQETTEQAKRQSWKHIGKTGVNYKLEVFVV